MTKEKKIITPEEKKKKEKYRNDWNAEHLDRINLTMSKGRKELIQAHAQERNESVNAFINRAIDALMCAEQAESTNMKEAGEHNNAE